MGIRHFKQMYADAVEVDRQAVVTAMLMATETPAERASTVPYLWKDMPRDALLDIARKAEQIGEEFTEQIKIMLLTGDITVLMTDQAGHTHKVNDPDVIDFDAPTLSDAGLLLALGIYLSEKKLKQGEHN